MTPKIDLEYSNLKGRAKKKHLRYMIACAHSQHLALETVRSIHLLICGEENG